MIRASLIRLSRCATSQTPLLILPNATQPHSLTARDALIPACILTMAAPKPILRRVRAESNEIDSILFSDLDSVAAADGSSTNSAAKPSKKRTAQEFISKKSVWEYKLAKCKNALARSVVQNAFTKHTPSGRKGTRFPSNEGNIVPEKEVMTAHLILAPPSKRARIVTTNRKKGWSSAGKPAKKRTAQELAAKQPVWQMKLAKLKNALARKVVEKAFANSTPQGWKKKRFDSNEGRIVPEKEVMTVHLILSDEANISAQRNTGRMGQTIIGRGCKAKVRGSFSVLVTIHSNPMPSKHQKPSRNDSRPTPMMHCDTPS